MKTPPIDKPATPFEAVAEALPKPGAGRIRVGIIGVGNWANHGHIPSLNLLPGYEVVAVQSRRPEAAQASAARFGIKTVVATVAELVALPEVDLVAVLTTAPQHEEGIRAAIAAGKDVYSEWPFTLSTEKAEELVALAQQAGVRHIMGLQRRFAPTNRYLHDLLRQGYVGRVRSVRLHVSMNYFQALRGNSLRWTIPAENFSSVVAIYAGHFLDALFSVVGKPKSFSSTLINQFAAVTIKETGEVFQTTTPDQLVMSGRLNDHAVFIVQVEGGKRNGSGVQLDITGDEGDLRVTNVSAFGAVGEDYVIEGAHGDNIPLAVLPVPDAYHLLPESNLPSSVLELAHLYAAYAADVQQGTHTPTTFEDGLWMHRFFDLMHQSSETGQRVTVPEYALAKATAV
ncbi:Gfo/Idh/MocA family protein [Hymenobacter terricola]|uniref:Gfo/Idh/MocA family protein n=1 Tax=Hymenobacter terricola TaxID=2819236 RepID=UPI001B315AD0|nr:Gfo/Idh/MocA family oxidoreductase [Hymenobacter terricola]